MRNCRNKRNSGRLLNYRDELTKSMTWLGEQPDTIFIGQGIVYGGHAMFDTLKYVGLAKRIEFPVAEEMQMGVSLGMALTGKIVISIFPRFDFLLLAVNQLVNHLDKLEDFAHGQFHAKVIIRVGVGSRTPLDPGPQHCGDYTEAFRKMLRYINVIKIEKAECALPSYQFAYGRRYSSIIVEDMNLYGQ